MSGVTFQGGALAQCTGNLHLAELLVSEWVLSLEPLIDNTCPTQATPTGDLDHVKLLEKYGLAYKVLSDPKQRNEYVEQINSGESEDGAMQQMPAQIKQVLGDKEVSSEAIAASEWVQCSAPEALYGVVQAASQGQLYNGL